MICWALVGISTNGQIATEKPNPREELGPADVSSARKATFLFNYAKQECHLEFRNRRKNIPPRTKTGWIEGIFAPSAQWGILITPDGINCDYIGQSGMFGFDISQITGIVGGRNFQ